MKNRIISYVMLFTVLSIFIITLAGCSTAEEIAIPTDTQSIYTDGEDMIIYDNVEKELDQMLEENGQTEPSEENYNQKKDNSREIFYIISIVVCIIIIFVLLFDAGTFSKKNDSLNRDK